MNSVISNKNNSTIISVVLLLICLPLIYNVYLYLKNKSTEAKIEEKEAEQEQSNINSILQQQQVDSKNFNVWATNSYYEYLVSKNPKYSVTLFDKNSLDSISEKLRSANFSYLNDDYTPLLKMCKTQSCVNQLVSEYTKTATFFNSGINLLDDIREHLTLFGMDQGFNDLMTYVNNLPIGIKKLN